MVEKLFNENIEKYELPEDFLDKIFNGELKYHNYEYIREYYSKNHTGKELEFLDYCYERACNVSIIGYKYNDPKLGEIEFNGKHDFEDQEISVNGDWGFKTLGIPFKVFGDHTAVKLGTLKML